MCVGYEQTSYAKLFGLFPPSCFNPSRFQKLIAACIAVCLTPLLQESVNRKKEKTKEINIYWSDSVVAGTCLSQKAKQQQKQREKKTMSC